LPPPASRRCCRCSRWPSTGRSGGSAGDRPRPVRARPPLVARGTPAPRGPPSGGGSCRPVREGDRPGRRHLAPLTSPSVIRDAM
jgi:hypothetical protein